MRSSNSYSASAYLPPLYDDMFVEHDDPLWTLEP